MSAAVDPQTAPPANPVAAVAVHATGQPHPTAAIDETVHQRHRLGILTITAEAQRAEFGYLRDALGLTRATCPGT